MIRSIFVSGGQPVSETAVSLPPFCCAVGGSDTGDWTGLVKQKPGTRAPADLGFGDIKWWGTGILIHPRVVLCAAHSPRSNTILGDRVWLPEIPGEDKEPRFNALHVRVSRVIDHPKAGRAAGYDVRLLILKDDDLDDDAKDQLFQRAQRPLNWPATDGGAGASKLGLIGIGSKGNSSPGFIRKPDFWIRYVEFLADADVEVHGHCPDLEYIVSPGEVAPWSGEGKPEVRGASLSHDASVGFGDSGAPIVLVEGDRFQSATKVVGMYVRRSNSRPVPRDPDLVVLRWCDGLEKWATAVASRYAIQLAFSNTKPQAAA